MTACKKEIEQRKKRHKNEDKRIRERNECREKSKKNMGIRGFEKEMSIKRWR